MQRNLEPLLLIALQATAGAFPEILSVYRGSFAVDTKADKSPITEADRRSNEVITEKLSQASPHPILSEEGRSIPFSERRHWQRFWLVDPLDGTREFVKRNGEFTINIAFVEGSVPVLGVVYAPLPDLLYFAWEDRSPRSGSYRLEGFSRLAAEIPRDLTARATRLPRKEPFDFDETHKRESITVIGSRSHRSPCFSDYVGELERRCAQASPCSACAAECSCSTWPTVDHSSSICRTSSAMTATGRGRGRSTCTRSSLRPTACYTRFLAGT